MSKEPMSYIGYKPCGCVLFAAVDLPDMAQDIADCIKETVAMGGKVERVTCEFVRKSIWECPKHKAETELKKAQMSLPLETI